MARRLTLLTLVGAAVFLAILTILFSSLTHMAHNTSLRIVCGAAVTIGLLLMGVGKSFALLEARRKAVHKDS